MEHSLRDFEAVFFSFVVKNVSTLEQHWGSGSQAAAGLSRAACAQNALRKSYKHLSKLSSDPFSPGLFQCHFQSFRHLVDFILNRPRRQKITKQRRKTFPAKTEFDTAQPKTKRVKTQSQTFVQQTAKQANSNST